MDQEMLSVLMFVAAGILLALIVMRRRKRKLLK
jgi:LPXTG-motif cell wall-anchored protein